MSAIALAPRCRRVAQARLRAYTWRMQTLRSGKKTAVKFVTPSGVTAVVASGVPAELMTAMKAKLERKLRRSGHLPAKTRSASSKSVASSV